MVLFPYLSFAQGIPQFNRQFTFKAAAAGAATDVTGLGLGWAKVVWDVRNGTLSACTFTLQGSVDGITFVDISGAPITCTTDNQTNIFPLTVNSSFLRINVATLTINGGANTSITFAIQGWIEAQGSPGTQVVLQLPQVSGITATTVTRSSLIGMSQFQNCYILLNITAGGTATGTLQIYIQDSVDQGTTWDDLVSSLTFSLGGAATTQRFLVSGTVVPATITTAASTNITQGSAVSVEALGAGSARQGPWGDRWRVREKITGPSGSPVGATYTINAVCKR